MTHETDIMNLPWTISLPCHDPYDLWASSFGVLVKERYYSGSITGKLGAVGLGLADWLFPNVIRKLVGTKKIVYPINIGHEALIRDTLSRLDEASEKNITSSNHGSCIS